MQDISQELFLQWRSPRFGDSNPTRMNNPVWESIIQCGESAYAINERFSGPSPFDAGPGWCFDRFGQSATTLADGRVILIAGEHEDYYDPDFYIYNDVVVKHPNGAIDIYGYPRDVFPPTDFHSATLAGDKIVLIGSLGYDAERRPDATQVLILDLVDFSVRLVESGGELPGWIHGHEATLAADGRSICITKGLCDRGTGMSFAENFDDWTLTLDTWKWQRSLHRNWQTWTVRRQDKKNSRLWQLRHLLWLRGRKNDKNFAGQFEDDMERVTQESGGRAPDLDIIPTLYRPSLAHQELPQGEEEFNIYRTLIDGVVVRYVEEGMAIRVVVEGELPSLRIQVLQADLLEKLQQVEKTAWELEEG